MKHLADKCINNGAWLEGLEVQRQGKLVFLFVVFFDHGVKAKASRCLTAEVIQPHFEVTPTAINQDGKHKQ